MSYFYRLCHAVYCALTGSNTLVVNIHLSA